MKQQPVAGQDLFMIEASQSHSDTPHPIGLPGLMKSQAQSIVSNFTRKIVWSLSVTVYPGRDLNWEPPLYTLSPPYAALFNCDFSAFNCERLAVSKRNSVFSSSCRKVANGKDSLLCKVKAFPLQALTGPEGSWSLRLPDFQTIGA
jgi:hypothetical protein